MRISKILILCSLAEWNYASPQNVKKNTITRFKKLGLFEEKENTIRVNKLELAKKCRQYLYYNEFEDPNSFKKTDWANTDQEHLKNSDVDNVEIGQLSDLPDFDDKGILVAKFLFSKIREKRDL